VGDEVAEWEQEMLSICVSVCANGSVCVCCVSDCACASVTTYVSVFVWKSLCVCFFASDCMRVCLCVHMSVRVSACLSLTHLCGIW
jgi:hypothetical protein